MSRPLSPLSYGPPPLASIPRPIQRRPPTTVSGLSTLVRVVLSMLGWPRLPTPAAIPAIPAVATATAVAATAAAAATTSAAATAPAPTTAAATISAAEASATAPTATISAAAETTTPEAAATASAAATSASTEAASTTSAAAPTPATVAAPTAAEATTAAERAGLRLEALATIDGAVTARLEGYLGVLTARSAGYAEQLPHRTRATGACPATLFTLADTPAVRTAARVVGEALGEMKLLLPGRECEFRPAVAASERFVGVWHPTTS